MKTVLPDREPQAGFDGRLGNTQKLIFVQKSRSLK